MSMFSINFRLTFSVIVIFCFISKFNCLISLSDMNTLRSEGRKLTYNSRSDTAFFLSCSDYVTSAQVPYKRVSTDYPFEMIVSYTNYYYQQNKVRSAWNRRIYSTVNVPYIYQYRYAKASNCERISGRLYCDSYISYFKDKNTFQVMINYSRQYETDPIMNKIIHRSLQYQNYFKTVYGKL